MGQLNFIVKLNKCIMCGDCISACPYRILGSTGMVDRTPIMIESMKSYCKYSSCTKCMDNCPNHAIKITHTKCIEKVTRQNYDKFEAIISDEESYEEISIKFASINFETLIKEYDLATIRSSHVQYYAETIHWFDNLLTNIDAFIREHADLLSEAQILNNRLTVAPHDDEYPVLTERAVYLARHLDFGVETMQSELIAFKDEVVAGRDTLANARNLTALREIEKLERPDFYLVAEHTANMVKRQLAGVDWFREHKELAATLIDLHEAWRDEFHLFEHTTRDHFMQKCKDESIDEEQADGWFAEWRKERLLLEEHLLPLMKAGIEKVIPVEVVISAVDVLKSAIRDQLGKFFFEKRISLYQEFGSVLGRFEKEAELSKITAGFQKVLEDLVFEIDTIEGRLFLVRWAKDWYDSIVSDVLVFIEQDTLQEKIARDTLDEFRAMKRRNLEAFLVDARSYAEAREQIDKQWISLVFRMRQDLMKKNGKGSK